MISRAPKPPGSLLSRRAWISRLAGAGAGLMVGPALLSTGWCRAEPPKARRAAPVPRVFSRSDEEFLDELERRGCLFFWENGSRTTGLVKDRVTAGGPDSRIVASIAATGFGLTALVIAHKRRYLPREDILTRVLATLRFLWNTFPHEHGFFYHFVDWQTGERVWKCELSSIDTAILMCGIISAGEYFDDLEIRSLARRLVERVDWPWMLNGGPTLTHGWKPETGFLNSRWDHYCELMMIYLLALGSESHPIPAQCWEAWARPRRSYEGVDYIWSRAPLFVHQYSHAWFDFRGQRDRHADFFENSARATDAHRRFCVGLSAKFPHFSERLWGITSSDSERGYVEWGGPPAAGSLDGTVVPCAAGGSLPFRPEACIETLQFMRENYEARVWKRYGFVDAFNPATGWTAPDVIGIDVGITVLMAENARTGFVWEIFMRHPAMRRGMSRAGFKPSPRLPVR